MTIDPRRLSAARLARWGADVTRGPQSAADALLDAGCLAPWLFEPEIFRVAAEAIGAGPRASAWRKWSASPRLPHGRGVGTVFAAWEQAHAGLAEVVALPLEWRFGDEDDLLLPPDLHRVAVSVRTVLGGRAEGWTLHRHGLDDWDLSALSFATAGSAWLPLAISLRLALDHLAMDPGTVASGAWQDGIRQVEHLPAKALRAAGLKARLMLVPPGQEGQTTHILASRAVAPAVEIGTAIGGVLVDAAVRPTRLEEGIEACRAYARLFPNDQREKRESFETAELLPEACERLALTAPGLRGLAMLVSSQAALLAIAATAAPKLLPIINDHTRSTWQRIAGDLSFDDELVMSADEPAQAVAVLTDWLRANVPAAVDVTGGTKAMTAAATVAAVAAGAGVFAVHTHKDGFAHQPGTERLIWILKPSAGALQCPP